MSKYSRILVLLGIFMLMPYIYSNTVDSTDSLPDGVELNSSINTGVDISYNDDLSIVENIPTLKQKSRIFLASGWSGVLGGLFLVAGIVIKIIEKKGSWHLYN